jgi:hypothetical protein
MKNYKCLFCFILFFILLGCLAFNVQAGNASTYKITVQSIQLKKDTGSWVTITSPNQEIDIASVAQNSVASSFSNVVIPAGNYVNFKCVVSETVKFSGSDGAGHYTASGGVLTLTGDGTVNSTTDWTADPPEANVTLTENAETHSAASEGEITANLDIHPSDGDNYMEIYKITDLATPIVVNASSKISMYFDFDTQNTIHYVSVAGNDTMYFTPPQTGTKFEMAVDGVTTTITEAEMKIDF